MQIQFYEFGSIPNDGLKFAVITARYKGHWILVRHRERCTWEIPGGRREPGEAIADTARRELVEETGAAVFSLAPVCLYSVKRELSDESYGGLFFAEVEEWGVLPDSEIAEAARFEQLPQLPELTYPGIQPVLFERTRLFLENGH
ncbi:MAG: hydrolase [Paenibacillaceae bacterium]|nr:hydrolase [Paenibacillaceae bacterium]